MENWRKYLNEGVPTKSHPWGGEYEPYTPGDLAYEASEGKKPVVDLSKYKRGSAGIPEDIMKKLALNLVTPCTGTADCDIKRRGQETSDLHQPSDLEKALDHIPEKWPGQHAWSDEQYPYIIDLYMRVSEHAQSERDILPEFNIFDEQLENATSEKEADYLLQDFSDIWERYLKNP